MPGFLFPLRESSEPIAIGRRAFDNPAMRVIILTLLFFMALGIGANCRTPGIVSADCGPGTDCDLIPHVAD